VIVLSVIAASLGLLLYANGLWGLLLSHAPKPRRAELPRARIR